jgi:hypothetical protein
MNMIRNTVARKSAWLSTTALVAAMHLGESALAQATSRPPDRMTYQGFIAGSDGVALGNTAPKNYDVIFRIYDTETDGVALWGEQQTVTVDAGLFSVLLGEGAPVTGIPNAGVTLSSLFNGGSASDRYVGITVKGIGNGGTDVEVLPRMRFLSSPYAFLANQSLSAQTAVKLVQDNSGGADLLTSSGNMLNISGSLSIAGGGSLVLGAGDPTKGDPLNGRIGYALQTPGALDVIGTGATQADRKIQFSAEGGSTFTGPVTTTDLTASGTVRAASLNATNLNLSGPFVASNINASEVSASALKVRNYSFLELGAGLPKTDPKNGTISYGTQVGFSLELFGGGSTTASRRVDVFNNSFGMFYGPLGIKTGQPGTVISTVSDQTVIDLDVLNGIRTYQRMFARAYTTTSDRRIKNVVRIADAKEDLEILRQVKVTDYNEISHGKTTPGIVKGVLAHELRDVLPVAVSIGSGFVPLLEQPVLELLASEPGRIVKARFKTPHVLKNGQRIEALADGVTKILTVHEVVDERTICIEGLEEAPAVLHLTGKEVEDFLSVDYNQIFMLAVSGLQEVDRRLQEVEKRELKLEGLEKALQRIDELEKRAARVGELEAQAARLQVLEQRMIQLQQAMMDGKGLGNDEGSASISSSVPAGSVAVTR